MKQLGEMLCTWARCFISVKTSSILVLTFITSYHRKPYHTEKNNFIAKKKFNFSFEMSKQVEDGGLVLLVTFFLPTKKVRFWPLGNPFWCADKWGWDWKALLAGWPSLGAGTCSVHRADLHSWHWTSWDSSAPFRLGLENIWDGVWWKAMILWQIDHYCRD